MLSDSSSTPLTPEPTPAVAAKWRPGSALVMLGVTVAVYLASSTVGGVVMYLIYAAIHGSSTAEAWLNSSIVAQFLYTALVYGLLLWAIVVAFKRLGVSRAMIGLKKPRWVDPVYALAALPAYYISYAVILSLVTALVPHFNADQSQKLGFTGAHGPALLLVFASLVVIPPLIEEIVVRGYLYTGLKRTLPKAVAIIATSLLFAIGHLEFGNGGPLVWVAAVFTFVLALVLTLLRELTGRIWAGIFLHALVNGVSFFYLFVASGH